MKNRKQKNIHISVFFLFVSLILLAVAITRTLFGIFDIPTLLVFVGVIIALLFTNIFKPSDLDFRF